MVAGSQLRLRLQPETSPLALNIGVGAIVAKFLARILLRQRHHLGCR
jgi:hypothetical protein